MSVKAYYFSAPWCQPCKSFKPVALPKIVDAGIEFQEINADVDIELVANENVMSIPTVIFVSEDGEFARVTGASTKQLDEALQRAKGYLEA